MAPTRTVGLLDLDAGEVAGYELVHLDGRAQEATNLHLDPA